MVCLFLLLGLLCSSKDARAFCVQDTELNQAMEEVFLPGEDYYASMSQGFCFAEDKIIYTRYSSDASQTTYVILDAKTLKEVNHQSFSTLHSNSLTYNPTSHQLVCVSQSHAYVFYFDGESLSLTEDHYMKHNCPKIAYVESENAYYLGTSNSIYRTSDFITLTKVFTVTKAGVDQGMASDGSDLYIIWYSVGYNTIYRYDLHGGLKEIYTLSSSDYLEIEEIDFYGEHMYVNIQNSGEYNGLYRIRNNHTFADWEVVKKEDCGNDGQKARVCTSCDYQQTKTIPATGDHKTSNWIITKQVTCSRDGEKLKECSVCGHELEKAIIPAMGHDIQDWHTVKEPDVLHEGKLKGYCRRCDKEVTESIDPLVAEIHMSQDELVLSKGEDHEARKVTLGYGDKIISWISSDPKVASVDQDGKIHARRYGRTTITCTSQGGVSSSYKVKVSFLHGIFGI